MTHNILLLVIIVLICCFLLLQKAGKLPRIWPEQKTSRDDRFTQQNITQTFISAIPTLTRQMNLEIATARQTEVLERKDHWQVLGFDLGTNLAQIKVPVTYRYHIRLFDPWKLEINGKTLRVRSPAIQTSLPPAIHTDELQQHAVRGWARRTPTALLQELHRDLTPTLSRYAGDPRQIDLVRETCRLGVAEFVQGWLNGERRWGPDGFSAIMVQFADEKALPQQPSLHLDFSPNQNAVRP